jgi:hypothetical protein
MYVILQQKPKGALTSFKSDECSPFYHGVGSVKINKREILVMSHFKSRCFLLSFFF